MSELTMGVKGRYTRIEELSKYNKFNYTVQILSMKLIISYFLRYYKVKLH